MTTKYDYLQAMINDIKDVLFDYFDEDEFMERLRDDRDELETELQEKLWIDDSVTGNGSGSYTFNAAKAGENLVENMDLYRDAIKEFGIDTETVVEHIDAPEYMDVTIRCYLLSQAIEAVLDEYED